MRVALLLLLPLILVLARCGGGESGPPDAGPGGGGGGGSDDAGTDAGGAVLAGKAHALALHDGKLLVAGNRPGRGMDFLLARYFTDGGLDPSFGVGGIVTTDFRGPDGGILPRIDDSAFALAVTANDIVVVGGGRGPTVPVGGLAVARYTHDGALDSTFNMGGLRITAIPTSGGGFAEAAFYSVAIADDGHIYAGGSVVTGSSTGQDHAIVRIKPDGTTDTTFGGGGVLEDHGTKLDIVRGLFLQGTKVVAAGGEDFLVARYDSDSSLDTTFGTSGIGKSPGGEAFAAAARADGRFVLAGTHSVPGDGGSVSALKLVQYSAEGQLDTTFGTGGVVSVFPGLYMVKGLVVEPSGKLVVYGTYELNPAIARLNADGSPDTSFGTGGLLVREEYSLPIFEFVYSGQHALLQGNTLWFADTGQSSTQEGVFIGEGVLLGSQQLP